MKIKPFITLLLISSILVSLETSAQLNRADTKKSVSYRANYKRIFAGSMAWHGFEIRNGTLWGWGQNTDGKLGDGTTADRLSPVQVGTDDNWVSISATTGFTHGIKSDGTLWAWGKNEDGQLGDGSAITRYEPVQIGTDNKWISVSGGSDHVLGLKSDGTLWSWGKNFYGAVG
jgi:hypothetical protein